MPTQRFDGPTLEAALQQARKVAGETRVVAAHKVRSGGVGGWFSKEHVEVEVEIDEDAKKTRPSDAADGGQARTARSRRAAAPAGAGKPAPEATGARTAETRAAERRAASGEATRLRFDADDELVIDDPDADGPLSVLDLVDAMNTTEQARRERPTATVGAAAKSGTIFSSDKPWAKAPAGTDDSRRQHPLEQMPPGEELRSGRNFGSNDQRQPLPDSTGDVAATAAMSPEPSTERSAFSEVLLRIASEAGLPVTDTFDDHNGTVVDIDALTAELARPASHTEDVMAEAERLAIELGRSELANYPAAEIDEGLSLDDLSASQELMLRSASGTMFRSVGDDLFERSLSGGRATALARLGVPESLLPSTVPSDLGPTWRDLRQILVDALSTVPEPMPLPDGPGSVIAVIGTPKNAAAVATSISQELGLDPDNVVVATWRRLRRPNNPPLTSTQAVRDQRQSWQWRTEPTVVVLESGIRPDTVRWTRKMLVALDPTAAWGAVDAGLKLDDIAWWSQALGGLDALALVDLDGTTSPAAPLHLGLPIARIDGRVATAQAWADLLTERLTV